jgi:hypothetical protein
MRGHDAVALVLALGLAAPAAAGQAPPAGKQALLRWLRAGTYRQTYTPEPAVHRSLSNAHGLNVRTWYSPVLAEDLRAGRVPFRRGAAMVKELYATGEEDVLGWSVMRKLRRKSGRRGKGWLFSERLPGGGSFFGRGLPVCTGCHAAGVDYLLSPFRP